MPLWNPLQTAWNWLIRSGNFDEINSGKCVVQSMRSVTKLMLVSSDSGV